MTAFEGIGDVEFGIIPFAVPLAVVVNVAGFRPLEVALRVNELEIYLAAFFIVSGL